MLVYIKPLSIFPKLHSDTLFGAITSAINDLYPDKVDGMIKSFEDNNPPFILTSTFPYIISNKTRFYPKIITSTSVNPKNKDSLKAFKKIEFVEEEIFFDLIGGKLTESEIIENYSDFFPVKNLLMKEKIENIGFGSSVTPHNSVNRLTNETEAIFYGEGFEYENVGLFFFIEIFDEAYEKILRGALKYLSDRGFGRDISTGKGQFDYEIEDISYYDLNDVEGDRFATLSRFIPTEEDIEKIDLTSSYEIDSKQGRAPSGEIRKQIRFFKEGSTFSNTKEVYGKIIKSGKDTPAIEYGYAFPIQMGGN